MGWDRPAALAFSGDGRRMLLNFDDGYIRLCGM
jgi:hypothetical protein